VSQTYAISGSEEKRGKDKFFDILRVAGKSRKTRSDPEIKERQIGRCGQSKSTHGDPHERRSTTTKDESVKGSKAPPGMIQGGRQKGGIHTGEESAER